MNIKIVKLLAAICAFLMVALIAEWLAAKYALHRVLDPSQNTAAQPYQIDDVPTIDLTGKTEGHYADLVSRPLFIEGRRPVKETTSEQASALSGSEAFDWQLIGVYTVKNSLSALFGREKKPVAHDNFRKLKLNGDLDGWKLAEIHKDKVVLTQEGSEPKPLLLRKPKPKQLPTTQQPGKQQIPNRTQMHRGMNPPNPREEPPVPEPEIEEPPVPEPEIIEDAPEISENE